MKDEPIRDAKPDAAPADAPILGPRVGFVAGFEAGALLVDFEGNRRGPLPARSTIALDDRSALDAAATRAEVVLLFDGGDAARPLVMGLLRPVTPTPLLDLLLDPSAAEASDTEAAASAESAEITSPAEATVDGKRVLLEGEDEVVLRCGKASITLRRNGKIVIRGAYVETHASGTNRIKGGSVRIN